MTKNNINKFSIALNVIIIILLIIYIFVPFLNNSVLKKGFSLLCGIKQLYQGEEYLPDWCKLDQIADTVNQKVNVNTNQNINTNTNSNININTNTNTNTNTQIANPASVKCQEDGGTLEMITTVEGQAGLCVFADKSICDEWAYFRGECQKGKCYKMCKQADTKNEGWYNSCTDELIKYDNCAPDQDTSAATIKEISVTSPQADQQLSSPFQVEGRAKAADNKVYVRIKSKDGNALIDLSGSVKNVGTDGFGDFSIKVTYEFSTTKEGFVEVFGKSEETETNLVSIPVKFY